MSLYRCADCGHGRNLYAYSQAVAYGPVHADGLLAEHDHVDDCFVFVDSIECCLHPGAAVETKIGARFHVWRRCEGQCEGEAYRRDRWGRLCPDCGGTGGEFALPDRQLGSSAAGKEPRQ